MRRVGIILLCSAVVLLIGGALYLSKRDKEEPLSPPQLAVQKDLFQRLSPETLAQLSAIEAKEQQMNETVWGPEILAQE